MKFQKIMAAAGSLAVALTLVGCTSATDQTATERNYSNAQTDNVDSSDTAQIGDVPEFNAVEDVEVGDHLATAQTKSWQVDVYQVGTAPISEGTGAVMDDTLENAEGMLVEAGTEMAYFNFVFTNISGGTIGVPVAFGQPELRSETWDYDISMPSDFNFDAYESFGISMPLTKEEFYEAEELDVKAGESISRGSSAVYEKGVAIYAEMAFPTVDENGTVDHDGEETATVKFTMK